MGSNAADIIKDLQAIEPDINDLKQSTKDIENSFRNVDRELRQAMSTALPRRNMIERLLRYDAQDPYYNRIKELHDRWPGFLTEFIRLRNESRAVASDASSDLAELIGPLAKCIQNPAISPFDKQAMIATFRLRVGNNQIRANKMATGFENLRNSVKSFGIEVGTLANDCSQDILRLDTEMKVIQKHIDDIYNGLPKQTAMTALGTGLAIGAVSAAGQLAFVCLGIICPHFFVATGALASLIIATPLALEYKKLFEARWELKKAEAAQKGAAQIAHILGGLTNDLHLIVARLSTFALIWNIIDLALRDMEKKAEAADGYTMIPGGDQYTDDNLKLTLQLCRGLMSALGKYARVSFD